MHFGRFVSCLAFVQAKECPQGLLLSGGGDSTVGNSFNLSRFRHPDYFVHDSRLDGSNVNCFSQVRLWDIDSGALLDTCEVANKVFFFFFLYLPKAQSYIILFIFIFTKKAF